MKLIHSKDNGNDMLKSKEVIEDLSDILIKIESNLNNKNSPQKNKKPTNNDKK